MNKIYKVIWSKTRNCYVAVAEFVKRNGKGGSSLNRRHVAAALEAVAICAAPMSGWAEIGLRLEATKSSPWRADINLAGFAGKHRGISGNIAVAYTF